MKKQNKLTDDEVKLILNLEQYGWGGAISDGLSGAATGASIGSMFGPGPGTAIGAGVGALAGIAQGVIGDSEQAKADKIASTRAQIDARRQVFDVADNGLGNWMPPMMKDGGPIESRVDFPGVKYANPYLVPEYNQPMDGNRILPDVNRPGLTGTNATEYKMGIGVNGKEIQIPTVVGGQYLGADNAVERYKLTNESFGEMKNPSAYSKFYDYANKLGLMKKENGGMINEYQGQTHQGPNGGIPVDAKGRPSAVSGNQPVALTENGEVSFGGYIFSDKLGDDKKRTYADEAKKVLNKYKIRLGDNFEKSDKLAEDSMNKLLNEIKSRNESSRVKSSYSRDDLNKFEWGGQQNEGDPPWGNKESIPYNAANMLVGKYAYDKLFGNKTQEDSGWPVGTPGRDNFFSDLYNKQTNTNNKTLDINSTDQPQQVASNKTPATTARAAIDPINTMDSLSTKLNIDNPSLITTPRIGENKATPATSGEPPKFDYTGAIVGGLGALSNIARGIFDKPTTHNPNEYMINSRYSPTYMRDDEAERSANNAYADQMRVAEGMSPTQSARYQQIAEANTQDRLSRMRERIFNINAELKNRAQAGNINIEEQNMRTRMGIEQGNEANQAAKDNLLSTGIGQLGNIAQAAARDKQGFDQTNKYLDMMKIAREKTDSYMQKYLDSGNINGGRVLHEEPVPKSTIGNEKTVVNKTAGEPINTEIPATDKNIMTTESGTKYVSTKGNNYAKDYHNPWGLGVEGKPDTARAFDDYNQAKKAVEHDFKIKIDAAKDRGYKNVYDLIKAYTALDENSQKFKNYINVVNNKAGLDTNTSIKDVTPKQMAKAILYFENKDYVDKVYGGTK